MPLLDVQDLKTHFFTEDGVVQAVDGVSFQIEPGEKMGLVGESGCGKSVTALSVMRLVPDPPGKIVAGSIRFEGRDILSF
jgi:ABC-type dipeptide/oligopeptide/nickel transport system ATPase component